VVTGHEDGQDFVILEKNAGVGPNALSLVDSRTVAGATMRLAARTGTEGKMKRRVT